MPALALSLGLPFRSTGGGAAGPPATPTGLTATAGNQMVSLTWNASAGATSYKVYYSLTNSFGTAAEVSESPTATPGLDVSLDLQAGELYYFWVVATNAVGDSAESGSDSARPYVTLANGASINLMTPSGAWTLGTLFFGTGGLPDNFYATVDAVLYLTFGGEWLDATTEGPANSVVVSGAFSANNNTGGTFTFWNTEP